MSIYTYSIDLKTVMYFFMEQGWLESSDRKRLG